MIYEYKNLKASNYNNALKATLQKVIATVENIIFLNNTIRDKISFKIIISYLYLTDSLR